MKKTVGFPAAFVRRGGRSGSLPAGRRSSHATRLHAASREPSRPPCSGARACARGNSSSSRKERLPVLLAALRAFSVLRPMGRAARAACPGLRLARSPAAPLHPLAGLICGLVGRRSGWRSAHKHRTTRQGRSTAKQSSAAPGATETKRVCSGHRLGRARHGETARSERTAQGHRAGPAEALRPQQAKPHVRANPLRPRWGRGTVETMGSNSPTAPTWPDSPKGTDSIVLFMAQW